MLYRRGEATVALLRRAPVIPVLTVKDVEDALVQARALIAGGLTVLEITLRTAAATHEPQRRRFRPGRRACSGGDEIEKAIEKFKE